MVVGGRVSRHEHAGNSMGVTVRGSGHAHIGELVEVASAAGAKRLLITHHGRHPDDGLERRGEAAQALAATLGDVQVDLARKGMSSDLL